MKLLSRLFILVVIALSPALAVLVYNQFELYQTQVAGIHNEVLQAAIQVAAEEEQTTEAVRQLLVALSSIKSVREQTDACNGVVNGLAPQYPNYELLGATDALVCGSVVLPSHFLAASPWQIAPSSSKLCKVISFQLVNIASATSTKSI